MANTYSQIYLHVVFAVSGRGCIIRPNRKEELQKYITGIVTRRNFLTMSVTFSGQLNEPCLRTCRSDGAWLLLGRYAIDIPLLTELNLVLTK
jgi:hypothetical protein